MLYREVDHEKHNPLYALVGTFFVALALFTYQAGLGLMNDARVLGTQIGGDVQTTSGQTPTQEGQGSGSGAGTGTGGATQNPGEPAPTAAIQQPTQAPAQPQEPSPIPVIPTDIPSEPVQPTPPPVGEEVTITDPTVEIIVRNEDNTLVIVDSNGNVPLATAPSLEPSTSVATTPTTTTGSSPDIQPGTNPQQTSPSVGSHDTGAGTTVTASTPSLIDRLFGLSPETPTAPAQHTSNSIRITYASNIPTENLDAWLRKYQYQVWALGDKDVAIYRNGIVALTEYSVKLSLSKLSLKLLTDQGEKLALYSHDGVWSYLSDTLNIISKDTQVEPMRLALENDHLVYHITGDSRQMFFAIIPVRVCMKIDVSAETRDILDSHRCSQLETLKDFFSIRI